MSFPRYSLILYDASKDKCWKLLNHHFIIEEKINSVKGVFLRDMWFNYDIPENDLYFMITLIRDENHLCTIRDSILNNPVLNNNGIPNINSIPIQSSFSRCFILSNNMVNNTKKKIKQNKEQIILYQDNCYFKIYIVKCNNKYTVTLPSFELN
jgi:hypothetical protein